MSVEFYSNFKLCWINYRNIWQTKTKPIVFDTLNRKCIFLLQGEWSWIEKNNQKKNNSLKLGQIIQLKKINQKHLTLPGRGGRAV